MNGFEVSLPIVRNAGTIGYVSVKWHATINGRPATGDLHPLSGEVSFAPGETMKTLKVEILADDVPELEEVNTIFSAVIEIVKDCPLPVNACINLCCRSSG